MKIDGNSPNSNIDPLGPSKTEAARQYSGASTAPAGSASTSDTVQLSPEAQLADRLRQAAAAAPDVRQDRVAEARRKLEAGEIGQDPMALADRLIDQMLEG
jgi:flagellar biosynthesis anti-sigma factor FlgM